MSKKLIAIAAATALALTGLVATSASAATYSTAVTGATAGTGTSADPYTVPVPTGDVLRWESTAANNTTLKFVVTKTADATSVNVSSTGSIKLITAAQLADSASDSTTGAATLSDSAVASTYTFYARTTSTTAGTVTVTNDGNTSTFNVKGIAGKAYKVAYTGPSIASTGVAYSVTAKVTDMFGNPVSGLVAGHFTATGLGAFASSITETVTESTTKGTYTVKTAAGDVTTSGAGMLSVVLGGSGASAEVTAFGDQALTGTVSVNSTDPAVSITALTAQVASLQASVTALTADYNSLATKYNKLVKKSKRVAKK
jgi:hypothetical protein